MKYRDQYTRFWAVVSGFAVTVGGASALAPTVWASTPTSTAAPVFPDEEDFWEEIRQILEIICMLIPCFSSHAQSDMPPDIAAKINAVNEAYATYGVYPNLPEYLRTTGIQACQDGMKLIETHPGLISDPELEAEFMQTLLGMLQDLENAGRSR
jgi:hypothetical protein